jgi:histone H3/H4
LSSSYVRTTALREIRRLQKKVQTVILKAPFSRLVRDVAREKSTLGDKIRFQSRALEILQEAAEMFLVSEFESKLSVAQVTLQISKILH